MKSVFFLDMAERLGYKLGHTSTEAQVNTRTGWQHQSAGRDASGSRATDWHPSAGRGGGETVGRLAHFIVLPAVLLICIIVLISIDVCRTVYGQGGPYARTDA